MATGGGEPKRFTGKLWTERRNEGFWDRRDGQKEGGSKGKSGQKHLVKRDHKPAFAYQKQKTGRKRMKNVIAG